MNQNNRNHPEVEGEQISDDIPERDSFSMLKALPGSMLRATTRAIRNFIPSLRNRYRRWQNMKNRLPKRTGRNRVYMLIGYTSKEHVDNRYRAMKVQNIIRILILVCILIALLFIGYKALNPFGNMDELKQIVGFDDLNDLTKDDPFSARPDSTSLYVNPNVSGESSEHVEGSLQNTPTP